MDLLRDCHLLPSPLCGLGLIIFAPPGFIQNNSPVDPGNGGSPPFVKPLPIEIWCRCPVSICESRDIKNLYHRARQGEISDFTGISSVYETPENPELIIDSEHLSVEDSLAALLAYLKDHGYLNNA